MRNFKKYIYKGYAVLGICSVLLGNTYVIAQAKVLGNNNSLGVEENIDNKDNSDLLVLDSLNKNDDYIKRKVDTNNISKDENNTSKSNYNEKKTEADTNNEIKGTPIKVELTAYCSDEECSGSWGNITAMGTQTRVGVVAAPSSIKLGSKLYIPELEYYKSDGIFNVEDRGGAVKVKPDGTYIIDVWFPTHEQTVEFGRKSTTVYLMNK